MLLLLVGVTAVSAIAFRGNRQQQAAVSTVAAQDQPVPQPSPAETTIQTSTLLLMVTTRVQERLCLSVQNRAGFLSAIEAGR